MNIFHDPEAIYLQMREKMENDQSILPITPMLTAKITIPDLLIPTTSDISSARGSSKSQMCLRSFRHLLLFYFYQDRVAGILCVEKTMNSRRAVRRAVSKLI